MWEPFPARFPGDTVVESVIIIIYYFISALMSKKAKSQAVTRNTNATYNMEGTEAVSPELNSIRPISRLF